MRSFRIPTTTDHKKVDDPWDAIRDVFDDLSSGKLPRREVPQWTAKQANSHVASQVEGKTSRAQRCLDYYSEYTRTLKRLTEVQQVREHVMGEIREYLASDEGRAADEEMLGRLSTNTSTTARRKHAALCSAPAVQAQDVEPTNPHERQPYNIISWDQEFVYPDFEAMVQGGWEIFQRNRRRGGVALNNRPKRGSVLHQACDALQHSAEMPKICPARSFSFGPPEDHLGQGADPRFYCIIAWGEALTRTHCDRGAQAVLYHTYEGLNRFVGVPARCAALLQAASDTLFSKAFQEYANSAQLEGEALRLLGEHGALQYGEFGPDETLLILPRAGHAVLAGPDGKTVYAGEWWHRTIGQSKAKKWKDDEIMPDETVLTQQTKRKRPKKPASKRVDTDAEYGTRRSTRGSAPKQPKKEHAYIEDDGGGESDAAPDEESDEEGLSEANEEDEELSSPVYSESE